jgi:hypothetical protein
VDLLTLKGEADRAGWFGQAAEDTVKDAWMESDHVHVRHKQVTRL